MFDVKNRASTRAMTITGFDLGMSAGQVDEGQLQIWTGPGSWEDCNNAGCRNSEYTQIVDLMIPFKSWNNNRNGYIVDVTFDTPVEVQGGETQAFLIFFDVEVGGFDAYFGETVGDVLYSNSDLTVYWGSRVQCYGCSGGTSGTGEGFYERIYYEMAPTPKPTVAPTTPTEEPTPAPSA